MSSEFCQNLPEGAESTVFRITTSPVFGDHITTPMNPIDETTSGHQFQTAGYSWNSEARSSVMGVTLTEPGAAFSRRDYYGSVQSQGTPERPGEGYNVE